MSKYLFFSFKAKQGGSDDKLIHSTPRVSNTRPANIPKIDKMKILIKFSLFWGLRSHRNCGPQKLFPINLRPVEHFFSLECGPPINLSLRPLLYSFLSKVFRLKAANKNFPEIYQELRFNNKTLSKRTYSNDPDSSFISNLNNFKISDKNIIDTFKGVLIQHFC